MRPLALRRAFAFLLIAAPKGPPRIRWMSHILRILAALSFVHAFVLALFLAMFSTVANPTLWGTLGMFLFTIIWTGLCIVTNTAHLRWIDAHRNALAWAGLAGALQVAWVVPVFVNVAVVLSEPERWLGRDPLELRFFLAWRLPSALVFLGSFTVMLLSLRPDMGRELEERRRLRPVFLGPGPEPWRCVRCNLLFHAPDGRGEGICPACRSLARAGLLLVR